MTFEGTNTYILGSGRVAVIDPGPDDPSHLDAILAALDPAETVSHIFVTHSHLDHSPLARRLGDTFRTPILGFGAAHEGRSDLMQELALRSDLGGGEGIDDTFAPDQRLSDAEIVIGSNWSITAVHTPGHLANHLCLAFEGGMFSGDHVMGWASTLISPPDGDLGAFMASCDKLLEIPSKRYLPGHGDPVERPIERVQWLMDHRNGREATILSHLAKGPSTIAGLTEEIYKDTPKSLHAAAARNVLAHLLHLWEQDRVVATPSPGPDAQFALR